MPELNLGILTKLLGSQPTPAPSIDPGKMRYYKHPSTATSGNAHYFKMNTVHPEADMPYFLPVTISYDSSILAFNEFFIPSSQPVKNEIVLPFPVVSLSSRKRIIETPLTQRNATVKELINIDGIQINIRGTMVGKYGAFPENDMIMLRNLYERNEAVTISCAVTDIFLKRPDAKDMVVITSLTFPEKRGNKNVREYEMTLVNDAPFNLYEI